MKRAIQSVVVLALAAQALVIGQGAEVTRILSAMRTALGGDALGAVKTVAVEGRATRVRPDGSSAESGFKMFMELPDKFVRRDVIAQLGATGITRRSGFSGADLIEEVDTPPSMGGGRMMVMRPGDPMPGGEATPEQLESQRRALLVAARRDFTRLSLGMFGTGTPALPVAFTYGGQAESPDGTAHVLDVQGPEGFAARLFVDASSHLPLMLTWMDKEPLVMRRTAGGPGGAQFMRGGGAAHAPTPQDVERLREDAARQMREAEANRRTVEHRLFYGEYKTIDGVRLPSKIQRMVNGLPAEELALDRIRLNGTLSPDTFKSK
jgi:hypothetical protein